MSDFKKLKVWRKAHALALNVYRVGTRLRGADHAPLRSQFLRAALSIPANIVEGTGQSSGREFGRFLGIAIKSSSELEYHLILSRDIGAISRSDFESLCTQTIETRKMLHGLRARVVITPRKTHANVPAS